MATMRWIWWVGVIGLVGCGGPNEGDACSGTAKLCRDNATAMQCQHGKLHIVQCRGLGCRDFSGAISCDQSMSLVGDGCFLEEEGLGKCGVGAAEVCQDGTWVLIKCCPDCFYTPNGYSCDTTCNTT
jgi:hypothetical protein